MTFLELLQKNFSETLSGKTSLKKEEALQAQRFDDGNDFQSQEQEPYQEVGIADSAANQSASAAFQRSKSRETAPKNSPSGYKN